MHGYEITKEKYILKKYQKGWKAIKYCRTFYSTDN